MAWGPELDILSETIRTAGAEAVRLATDGFETHTKPDRSPVTSADLAVNQILRSYLLARFPADGWLSEESPDDAARLQKTRVWVVDPIDGTKAFIQGEPEFCISVALVQERRPVVAAIFNPSTNELFSATRGGGLHLNHEPVSPSEHLKDHPPVLAVSPWEQHLGRFKSLDEQVASRPMRSIAWALALAASGRIHAVATFEVENEWDVAAGTLLVEEAGGSMHDGEGQDLSFNRPEPRYRGIIATHASCPDRVTRQLRSLARLW
ncbi:MAG TPA: 3'(2'),5'-bisphosphate nucleotidase CysQ [Nitrospira sp.]|nr:3'(2'),5'-bisphosphate nucleotidase CysQ [Nitrospira sp.]